MNTSATSFSHSSSAAPMTPPTPRASEGHVSARLVWPFLRVARACDSATSILMSEGIDLQRCVRPETRIGHHIVIRALTAYIRSTDDWTIGLRAADSLESGDFDIVELTARCCPSVEEGISCGARYVHLLNESTEMTLVREGATALWSFRASNGAVSHPAANDFVVAAGTNLLRRYANIAEPPIEVHLMHPEPADIEPYKQAFRTKIRFGMPCNAILLDASRLTLPLLRDDPTIRAVFEAYAREQLDCLATGVRRRIVDVAAEELRAGKLTMDSVSRRLGLSAATLRRRLEDEGTTFREIVDEVRRGLAEQHLLDRRFGIGEIAFLLGFSNVSAFNKAFRRWNASSPSEYRAKLLERTMGTGDVRGKTYGPIRQA
jgi:AraC-like DNA-binding protein